MRASTLVPLAFLAWPVLEIALFVEVGGRIGVLATILAVLAGVVVGAALVRLSGLRLLAGFRAELAAGRPPARDLVGGAMTAIAGLLFIVPGFASDLAGLVLLLPPLQRIAADRLAAGITVVCGPGFSATSRPAPGVVDLDPDDFARRPDGDSPWRGPGEPPAIDRR